MTRTTTGNAKQSLVEAVRRVASKRERIIVSSQGKDVAVIVPMEDLAALEEMEDRRDLEQAKKSLAQSRKKGEKPIPWAKAKKELGL